MAEPGGTLVDWNLAERVALALAGEGPAWQGPGAEVLRDESDRAVELVCGYTGLRPRGEVPAAELIGREEWVQMNLEAFRSISGEVERALAMGLTDGESSPGVIARSATGIEIGLLTGYLAQRVVGQYEVGLFGPARTPRLIFVAPNLTSAQDRLEAEPELFMRWIALHEGTHAVQFASVPWLRTHIGGIAEELLTGASVQVKPGDLFAKLKALNPLDLVRSVKSGDLATLLVPAEQREGLDRITSAMTIVEGYAEHVMDAVGAELDPGFGQLRESMDRERANRGTLDSVVAKLLGMQMKMAQYSRGKAFCDAVASRGGIATLNQVWDSPESLPSAAELEDPGVWIDRVGGDPAPGLTRRRALFSRR